MAITIRGVRIKTITISQDKDGKDCIRAEYQLISSTDKVLATETLTTETGYGTTPFTPAPKTLNALRDAVAAYKADVEITLGINE